MLSLEKLFYLAGEQKASDIHLTMESTYEVAQEKLLSPESLRR